MKRWKKGSAPNGSMLPSDAPSSGSRRKFLGNVSGAAVAAATVGAIGLKPLLGGENSILHAEDNGGLTGAARAAEAEEIRINAAKREEAVRIPNHPTNGDVERYIDQANTYTKCLPHDGFGRVDLNAFATFVSALKTGLPEDFDKITMCGVRTLNGPQGGLAFDLEGRDACQFGAPLVPPAPSLDSDLNATELVEMYWASLLRDVPFTQYASNPLAVAASAELSGLRPYQGPRNNSGQVTPDLLFRGGFAGETLGPYMSQFFLMPTFLGQQPISQRQGTYVSNVDFMTDFASWLAVQNGADTGQRNQ